MKRINVTKYGIVPNTDELLTNKIQSLIDSLSDGGEIYFPRGKYVLSTIVLRDNITINIAKGATLLGSLNFDDYLDLDPVDYPLYQDVSHSYFNCSMFLGKNLTNITFKGKGKIDLRSVWDEKNKNNMAHRGAKVIALKECKDVHVHDISLYNATDLAIYFAWCEYVWVKGVKLKVHIDGISPDNSKHVVIEDCNVFSGDDGIVFKSSYNLNKLGVCEDIKVRNCSIQSRCNAIKFGTESNGGFKDISIKDIKIKNTRISGIALESVDGAFVENISFENIVMKNVNAPIFIHLGNRLRGPKGSKIGSISKIKISNLVATGPYVPYKTIPWNYLSYVAKDYVQYPWSNEYKHTQEELKEKRNKHWQHTCNICGYNGKVISDITLENVYLELLGGVKEYSNDVPHTYCSYPEVYVYGSKLPAKGIYFRDIDGLRLKNVKVKTIKEDARPDFTFENVKRY